MRCPVNANGGSQEIRRSIRFWRSVKAKEENRAAK